MKALACVVAVLGGLAAAAPAAAQPANQLNGIYTFSSPMTRLTNGSLGQISGVMTVTPMGEGYHVSLSTMERLDDGASQSRGWSAQSCDGRKEGVEVVLTCEVLNSTPGYQADSFRLRHADGIRHEGELISADTYRIEMFFHSRR
ncbi:MAG TPA: hypothetical protein VGR32_13080 [Brevundimonas sp.]|jgi:hypothetical protein|uniref:hypothetical protein n=1 Tax=Brevundimonas sp. TaxID=1871086 RepID=UPI002DE2282D|nr:hypothetical protein [Brevundimonas sp.]